MPSCRNVSRFFGTDSTKSILTFGPISGAHFNPVVTLADASVAAEMSADGARSVVKALAESLAKAPRLDREQFRAIANEVKARTGQKGKALFHPIRIALTGRAVSPGLFETLVLIGRDEGVRRLEALARVLDRA